MTEAEASVHHVLLSQLAVEPELSNPLPEGRAEAVEARVHSGADPTVRCGQGPWSKVPLRQVRTPGARTTEGMSANTATAANHLAAPEVTRAGSLP